MNIEKLFASGWGAAWVEAALFVILLQLLLLRFAKHDRRQLLVQNTVLATLVVVSSLLGWLLPQLRMHDGASWFAAIAELLMGVLLIRLGGLTVFRAVLPRLGMMPPRIVEDVLMVLLYCAWGLVRLRATGIDPASLFTTSAIITGIIAFSMQDTLGNILGGIALQLDNSVKIGDWIKVDTTKGKVIEVHWRHTAVRTNDGNVVVIPNSVLVKSKVDVFSTPARPNFRRWVYFPVQFLIPPQSVIPVIEKTIREADIPYVAPYPAPQCVVMDYKDGMGVYALRYWLTDPRHDDSTDSTVRVHIYSALLRNNMQLARPYLDTHLTADSAERQTALHEQEIQQRLQLLAGVEAFSSLNQAELRELAESLHDAPFIKGDVMTKQGAVAHWLYFLVQGEADVWLEVSNQPRRFLNTLQAGSVFGEMGLLTGEPRRTTVTARTDALCYRLDKIGFQKIIQARPEIAEECARTIAERERQIALAHAEKTSVNSQEHEAHILASIKHFFGLG
ncbi:MAG: mechanosensitive ion channel family protein [Pseudomonadales bacterium]|jgi:small-conductance mechanosensitive channel|nr:mechanosensitive ion channel family protein [Pseudomonadales bacterium]